MLTTVALTLALAQSAPARDPSSEPHELLTCAQTLVGFQGVGERLVIDGRPVDVEWSDDGRDAIFIGGGDSENARHHFEILPGGGYQLDSEDCRRIETRW